MATRSPALRSVAESVRDLRHALGWSQAHLARKAGVSQSLVSAVETMELGGLSFAMAARLLESMGARMAVTIVPPYLGDRRQRDTAHALCTTYVGRRLEADGWVVASEVEIGSDRSRGWIDVLAYHPRSRMVLVIEVKTEIHDLGSIERTLGWYEREAWPAARRHGWQPGRVLGGLLLLATTVNDDRVADNRDSFRRGFPIRARDLTPVVAGSGASPRGRFAAMIDPRSRKAAWLRPMHLDGRRTPEPYADYADFLRATRAGRRVRSTS